MKIQYLQMFLIIFLSNDFQTLGQILPSDKQATPETKSLYYNLKQISQKGTLFGHQDDLTLDFYGHNSKDTSDLKRMYGNYPAVFGWDIGNIELDKPSNYWDVSFSKTAENIKRVYNMGGINTISWLIHDPANPNENSKSKSDSTVKNILSNPRTLIQYKLWLDKLAVYLNNLKGAHGEPIPIILRLFHENTGNWYWWGANRCTPEDFKKLFRFTILYLKNTKNLHNLLYAYCSDHFKSAKDYLERYPGDDIIDIIGVDMYDHPKYNYVEEGQNMVLILKSIGKTINKPFAIMETGLIDKQQDSWWTMNLLPVVKNSGLSYVLTWNNSPRVMYTPYIGQNNMDDFKIFSKEILFLKDISKQSVYKLSY